MSAFRFLILNIVVLVATGCTGQDGATNSQDYNEVAYNCEREGRVLVRFYKNEELAILIRNDELFELPQQPTGSGFYYTNGKVGIRGKGDEMRLEIGRMAPIHCQIEK